MLHRQLFSFMLFAKELSLCVLPRTVGTLHPTGRIQRVNRQHLPQRLHSKQSVLHPGSYYTISEVQSLLKAFGSPDSKPVDLRFLWNSDLVCGETSNSRGKGVKKAVLRSWLETVAVTPAPSLLGQPQGHASLPAHSTQ